jgi:hypothetical protein
MFILTIKWISLPCNITIRDDGFSLLHNLYVLKPFLNNFPHFSSKLDCSFKYYTFTLVSNLCSSLTHYFFKVDQLLVKNFYFPLKRCSLTKRRKNPNKFEQFFLLHSGRILDSFTQAWGSSPCSGAQFYTNFYVRNLPMLVIG